MFIFEYIIKEKIFTDIDLNYILNISRRTSKYFLMYDKKIQVNRIFYVAVIPISFIFTSYDNVLSAMSYANVARYKILMLHLSMFGFVNVTDFVGNSI